MRRLALALPLVLSLGAALPGCASSPLSEQLRAQNWSAVERGVRDAEARGEWSKQDTRELAAQVLELEIAAAPSTAAKQWIPGLRSCAGAVLPSLKARARKSDAPAAAITRILIEAEAISLADLVDQHRDARDPVWRAIALRAAVDRQDESLRLHGLRDPDNAVRRAALIAVRIAAEDSGSLPVDELLQIARLDPEPINRSLAARAATSRGDERAVLFLRDYWAEVALDERVTFVEAWAQPRAMAGGGERELDWVMGNESGLPAVVAALALQHHSEAARAVLLHTLQEGAPRERDLAVQMASLKHDELLDALKKLLDDPSLEDDSRVTALERLARVDKESKGAMAGLKKLAAGSGAAAFAARHALADLGDASVTSALLGELGFGSARLRLDAAAALLSLGQDGKVAPLLGDHARETRVKAACLVLAARPQ